MDAAEVVPAMVSDRSLGAELTGQWMYRGCAGMCCLGGADIAAELVPVGHGRDRRQHSGRRHAEEEWEVERADAAIRETCPRPGYCPVR